jgi:hypothetical protein
MNCPHVPLINRSKIDIDDIVERLTNLRVKEKDVPLQVFLKNMVPKRILSDLLGLVALEHLFKINYHFSKF